MDYTLFMVVDPSVHILDYTLFTRMDQCFYFFMDYSLQGWIIKVYSSMDKAVFIRVNQ